MSRSRFKLPWASKRSQQGSEDPGKSAHASQVKGKEGGSAPAAASMKISPIRSIGVQLFLYFFLIVIAAVASVGYLSYDTSRELIETQVRDATRLTAVQAAEKLDLVLKQYEDMSLEMTLLPEVDDVIQSNRLYKDDMLLQLETRRALVDRLNTYTFSNSTIAGLYLISMTDELPTMTNGSSLPPETVKESAWYQAAVAADGKGVWITTEARGPSEVQSNPAFGYARVVKDKSVFTSYFVLLVEVKESRLQEVLSGVFGEGSRMFVLDANGTIISSDDSSEIGQPFPVQLNGRDGAFQTEIEGTEMLVSYSELSGGWKLAGVQPYAPLVAGTQEIQKVTIYLLIAGAVAAVIVGYLIFRRIGTPLNRMSALMKQAESGDLSVQSPYARRSDEIGMLATGFNEMLSNIRALVEESNNSAQELLKTAADLGEASRRTATSAKEIAVATEQIAVGASNVAVEAEKVADVTAVMGNRMTDTKKANEEMAAAAADIRQASQQGTEYMQELSEKTTETEKLTQSMVRKVEELQKSTRSIRDILDLLNNITKQTNILSLNATIEAARAGEAGRGFMVVADEIRKLADQSKQSIETVGTITDGIRSEIDDTVRLMEQAYPMFQEQISSVKQSNEIFLAVNDRMGEFVVQLEDVSESVRQLEATQRTLSEAMSNVSAVAEESSATSEEVASLTSDQLQVGESLVGLAGRLEDVSKRLSETLNKFRL